MTQSEQNEILLWIESEFEKECCKDNQAVWVGKDSILDALTLTIYGFIHGGPTKFQHTMGEPLESLDQVKDKQPTTEYHQTAKAVLVALKLLKVQLVQG